MGGGARGRETERGRGRGRRGRGSERAREREMEGGREGVRRKREAGTEGGREGGREWDRAARECARAGPRPSNVWRPEYSARYLARGGVSVAHPAGEWGTSGRGTADTLLEGLAFSGSRRRRGPGCRLIPDRPPDSPPGPPALTFRLVGGSSQPGPGRTGPAAASFSPPSLYCRTRRKIINRFSISMARQSWWCVRAYV